MAVYDALTLCGAALSFLLALITSFFAWPEVAVFFVLSGYYFSFFVIAQTIGEQRGWHDSALRFYFLVLFITINIFAIIYWRYGLVQNGNNVEISYLTSIYFSITTWTTLGYGDFAPIERVRYITSVQAMLGYVSLGLLITLAAGYINNMAVNRKEVREHNERIIREHKDS